MIRPPHLSKAMSKARASYFTCACIMIAATAPAASCFACLLSSHVRKVCSHPHKKPFRSRDWLACSLGSSPSRSVIIATTLAAATTLTRWDWMRRS
jgi:hypothetical protein